jgi:hypothetical protein
VTWIGSSYAEYVAACNNINIIPRNGDPNIPTTTILPVDKISARQIRLWLIQHSISLQSVYDAINNIEDSTTRDSVNIEWEYAPYIERNHPMLVPLAQSLGLSETDIDRAFIEASSL